MGKSRKFSKGISNGFVPEYRHAVETMAESEGLGSSGRVDTDMTLSRHKYFSLNGDGHNQFAVPVQVLSLSKINRSERKDLEFKLRRDLDQVKILQKKVASIKFDSVVPKSSSSVFSAGKKRPPIQSIVHPLGKKQALGGGNGSVMKRAIPDHVVATNGVYNMVMKQCEGLLTQLMRHKSGWLFNSPVDVVKLNIPDYFTIIKNPMDFGTVKGKIAAGKYASPLEFAADVRLTFANAMTYNPAQNNVHIMAKGLSKYFESKWKTIEKKIPGDLQLFTLEKDASHVRSSVIDQGPPMKKKKLPPGTCTSKPESVNKNMSDEEKNKLNTELGSLAAELPDNIIEFLKDNISSEGQIVDDEIEIDIFSLNEDTLFKLRKLLDDYLMEKGSKAELCEIVLHNEGGLNKLSQHGKGNDAVEEDIDIGGNDSPVLSFPPIEIEKDIAHENIKACSSSTSSSTGSSSSDSDSDSGSLSGGKYEGAKPPNHLNSLEVTMYADETSNHKWINTEDSDIKRTETLSAQIEQNAETVPSSVEAGGRSEETLSAQVDQNAETVPSSVEAGGRSEGESAPCERQVSPEKVYRATLLKSRFADTILKAQEKTLHEGVKRDPEKLHIEREKHERMQKEEKSRLRAAALAAEEARKKADADTAAEARRKRELEREAARIALHKMEKTVDINESCELLEDLEILRADPPAEDLSSSAKDAYPENMDIVGNFKLQSSSNPLEQLGLYMKQDEEEEDVSAGEAPPGSTPYTANDGEEGGI